MYTLRASSITDDFDRRRAREREKRNALRLGNSLKVRLTDRQIWADEIILIEDRRRRRRRIVHLLLR